MSTGLQYEFSGEQNEQIGSLATKMRGVGVFSVVLGLIYLGIAILTALSIYRDKTRLGSMTAESWIELAIVAITGVVLASVGVWFRALSESFQKIVGTKGSDISHLMTALADLKNAFSLLYTVILISLFMMLLVLVMVVYGMVAK